MTIFPVPARVPVLSIRARFIFVPGVSDGYQDRICFTRSVRRMAVLRSSSRPGCYTLGWEAVISPLAGAAARPNSRPDPWVRSAPGARSAVLGLLGVDDRTHEPRACLGMADPAAEEGGPAQDGRAERGEHEQRDGDLAPEAFPPPGPDARDRHEDGTAECP